MHLILPGRLITLTTSISASPTVAATQLAPTASTSVLFLCLSACIDCQDQLWTWMQLNDGANKLIGNATGARATDLEPTLLVGSALPYLFNITFAMNLSGWDPSGDVTPIGLQYPGDYNNADLSVQMTWDTTYGTSPTGTKGCSNTQYMPHAGYHSQVRNFDCDFPIPAWEPQELTPPWQHT